jgi:hypothetical protein
VRADELLTAFLELEAAIRPCRANYLDKLATFFAKLGVAKPILNQVKAPKM